MTIQPQQFFKQGPVQVVGSGHLAGQEIAQTQPQSGFFSRNFPGLAQAGNDIKQAWQGGLEQTKQGFQQAAQVKGPLQGFESALKIGSGLASAATSPLAPVFKPIEQNVINPLGNKLAETSLFKDPNATYAPEAYNKIERGVQDVGNLANIAGTVGALGEAPAKIEAGVAKTGELAGKATEGLLTNTGKALKTAGERAYELTVPPSEATAKAMVAYDAKQPTLMERIKGLTGEGEKPITEANTAARMGLQGTEYGLAVQAKRAASRLWEKEIAPKLNQVKGAVNMKSFFDEIEKELQKTPELSRRADVRDALNSLREDYQNVGKNVDLSTLQKYKEGWAKQIPEAAYKGKPIGSALKEVKNVAAGKAREIIYKYVGKEGKQAYIDYGNLQSIIESGIKSISGDVAKKSISKNVWQFVMDKAVTPIATTAGKILYKTGEGLELIGPKGAKTVGDIVGNPKVGLSFEDASNKPIKGNMPVNDLITHESAPDVSRIEMYKNNLQAKQPVEPIKVVREKGGYAVEDGKHRLAAYKELGLDRIPVEILKKNSRYIKDMLGRFAGSKSVQK